MQKYNFYAGPSILSKFTIENTAKAVINFNDTGLSLMGISHRSKEFIAVIREAAVLFKELLDIPQGYSVLFLQGGASLQFAMVPLNYFNKKAAYLDTGEWASKAIKEARLFGETVIVASSKDKMYSYIPKGWSIPEDADYFHITSNNTIYGTELKEDLDSKIPLIADMSSDIFSRPLDVSKYALIYGGGQKNLAPAGVTFVIVKDDTLGKVERVLPTLLNYKTYIEKESMSNTPPCVAVYAALQTLKWYKQIGGVKVLQKMNIQKAELLYTEIERSKAFKLTVPNHEDRSIMNVTFVMNDNYKDKEAEFLDLCSKRGIIGIKGHRTVGGFRASIYNAMPIEGVKALIEVIKEFDKKI